MRELLKKHAGSIALALIGAFIIALPQLAFRFEYGNAPVYQGIELLPDSPWSPRVREVMDGHPSLGSIYYKDGKGDPYLFQPLGSIVVGGMGKVLGLNINDTFLFTRLVLTFVTVLLLYGFVYLLMRDRLVALLGTAVALLTDPLLNAAGLANFLKGAFPGHFLGLSLPVNNNMIFIPLFGFLVTFWLFYTRRDWRLGALAAVLLGLNFYSYFYSWTYLYAFGGTLVLIYLIKRQWREALRLGSVYLGGLVIALPYFVNLYKASQHPSYAEVAIRFGVIDTHTPLFIGFVALGALIACLLWFPREDRARYFFGLALLIAPIVTLNQQIFTGKEMQAAHYHWYFHKPMAIIFLIAIVYALINRGRFATYWKPLAVFGITVSVIAGAFTQMTGYRSHGVYGEQATLERQRFGPPMRWLNENATAEEVVLATDEPSHLVTIYTPLNVFYHRAGYASLSATHERLLDQLFTFYRLRGIGEREAREIFYKEREYLSANLYGLYYRQVKGSYEAIPDEKIEEMLAQYLDSLATPSNRWLRETLTEYEVNYLLWDQKNDPTWNLDKYSFLTKVADFGQISLYTVAP